MITKNTKQFGVEADHNRRPEPAGEVKEIQINGRVFKVGATLHEELENKIREILQKNIESLVDSASGCGLLSFMDAFSGYNQIRIHHWMKIK